MIGNYAKGLACLLLVGSLEVDASLWEQRFYTLLNFALNKPPHVSFQA